MSEHVALVPGDAVDVDTVKPGDEILVGRRKGYHLVSAVERHDDGAIVVAYFDTEQASYENRARDKSGTNAQKILCEKSLACMRAGDEVTVIRGSTGAAKTMRAKMEREMHERLGKKQWGGYRR